MTTFLKIKEKLKQAKRPSPLFFNDKTTPAYHRVNLIHNSNIYQIRTATKDNLTKTSNSLYVNGDHKTYKILNFKNDRIKAELANETVASTETIPEILAQLGQQNSNSNFEFYEKPFDVLKMVRRRLEEINGVFIFSKKCKQALSDTVDKLNNFLDDNSNDPQLKLKHFLTAFNGLIEEVNKNQETARKSRIIQLVAVGMGFGLAFLGAFMPIFTPMSLFLALTVPVLLSGMLICGLALGLTCISAVLYCEVYCQDYSSKENVNSIQSLYTQISFFSDKLSNNSEMSVTKEDSEHIAENN